MSADLDPLCDSVDGGCGHHIDHHPARVLPSKKARVGVVFDSRCTEPGCGCVGYVTPIPHDEPGPIRWKVAA